MLEYVIMGAQAAGMVGDVWATSASLKSAKLGQQLESSQFDLRLKQEQVASQEQTMASLEQLSEVLATQRAMASIRGGLPGIGSNAAMEQKSISNFNKDEKSRSLSLEFLGQRVQAQKSVGKLSLSGKEAEAGAGLFNRGFKQLPLNEWMTSLDKKNKDTTKATTGINSKTGLLTGVN